MLLLPSQSSCALVNNIHLLRKMSVAHNTRQVKIWYSKLAVWLSSLPFFPMSHCSTSPESVLTRFLSPAWRPTLHLLDISVMLWGSFIGSFLAWCLRALWISSVTSILHEWLWSFPGSGLSILYSISGSRACALSEKAHPHAGDPFWKLVESWDTRSCPLSWALYCVNF